MFFPQSAYSLVPFHPDELVHTRVRKGQNAGNMAQENEIKLG